MPETLTIAITGGSGSGKSTLANQIVAHFGESKAVVVEQDRYYRNLSHLPYEVAAENNFDHPDAIELDLLEKQLRKLQQGHPIQAPRYDFSSFSRHKDSEHISSKSLIIIEGLFVLHLEKLRSLCTASVFIDVPSEIRLQRRLKRDMAERGYSEAQIHNLWVNRAVPMFEQFVAPQRKHASHIWKSLEDKAFVTEFLADLENRLASNAFKPTKR